MLKWFIFNEKAGKDMYNPSNYFLPSKIKPMCNGESKLCAIHAEENGMEKPIINPEALAKDFIFAIQKEQDFGMVALNNKYKKKESFFKKILSHKQNSNNY